ncbi:MAG TPA: PLP-dependent aspartate aminotransferase family protein [Candidatus Thermoplasmatota archaeon]|nr:PLP-dependent aspartate aminotransferase family protein [Candidatus Thermoplasmatota archaeon]
MQAPPAPRAATTCVHGSGAADARNGAVNVPVWASTTFLYPELADGSPAPYIYGRYANPTVEAVERKVAALEGAGACLLFGSGLAAVHATVLALVRPGQTVAVQQGVYGGTVALLQEELAPLGIRVQGFDAHDARLRLPAGTALVWMESVTNPLLRVADVPAWAEAAHDVGARLAVDATFASPVLQRPLSLGADVSVHSGTKYLGGHSDVMAGSVACSAELREPLWQRRRNLGAVLDPFAAFLLDRGMKTLALRVRQHTANAAALAEEAARLPAVRAMHYPGAASHPDHHVAKRLLDGSGGMLTLDLGTAEQAVAFRRRLQVFQPAASLGGVESLASLPAETSHAYMGADARRALGIGDGLVRLSVGIEDVEDLRADLRRAAA